MVITSLDILVQESSIQTDCVHGCEKKVNAERSQALLGTTNLFRKLRREESAAKERAKAKKLLIFERLLLPYRENGCAVLFAIFYMNCMAVL